MNKGGARNSQPSSTDGALSAPRTSAPSLRCEFLEKGQPCMHLGTHYLETDDVGSSRVNVAYAHNYSGRCEVIEHGGTCPHGINHHVNYNGRVFRGQIEKTAVDPMSFEGRLAQLIWRCDFVERGIACQHGVDHRAEYQKLGLWPFPSLPDEREDVIMIDADTGNSV